MIRTVQDFLASEPGTWAVRAMFRDDPGDVAMTVETWEEFRAWAHTRREDFGPEGGDRYDAMEAWVNHIKTRFRIWSSGEQSLALAVLIAIDYAWLADEITGGKTGEELDRASGTYAQAVGACFVRADDL